MEIGKNRDAVNALLNQGFHRGDGIFQAVLGIQDDGLNAILLSGILKCLAEYSFQISDIS